MAMQLSTGLLAFWLLLAISLEIADGAKLPSEFPLCKKTDPNIGKCLSNAVMKSFAAMKSGVPSLGLPSFDPLVVEQIEFSQGEGSIAIKQTLSSISLFNVSESVVNDVTFDADKPLLNLNMTTSPVLKAQYEMDGSILVLPIKGSGPCQFDFKNVHLILRVIGKKTTKNGKTYLDVQKIQPEISDVESMNVKYENLFNGDKLVGETMNRLLNENWRDLWAELRPTLQDTFSHVLLGYTKRLFEKVPFDEIFLD